jgi:nucleoside 2-deoxyribosyltransferase
MSNQSARRFYIAARKDRAADADAVANALNSHGWHRTLAWSGTDSAETAEHAQTAMTELDAVREAEVLIVLLPGGFGTHVEMGAALALDKPVIIHAPDEATLAFPYPCVFHYHPRVTRLVSPTVDIPVLLTALQQAGEE